MFKPYYDLIKRGIVYGNVFTTLAGFLFASAWQFDRPHFFGLLLATLFGTALVVASACVFNNYIDRDIDRKMTRTRGRALALGTIAPWKALTYGTVLGLVGLGLLLAEVNMLAATLALFGFVSYVVFYGVSKRLSHWGTVLGSIPGAVPIVIGYAAAANRLDLSALFLFLTLALWQMPHFYAIAIYRLDDYVAAGIPVLPARKGIRATKIHILGYIIAYLFAASLLTVFGFAGYFYLVSTLCFGLWWLWLGVQGFKVADDAKWARKLFFFSLIVLVAFCLTVSVATLLS